MIEVIRNSIKFMSSRERAGFFLFLVGRSLTSVLDLMGVLAIGYLGTSIALFVAQGSSESRSFKLLGLTFPAANIQNLPLTLLIIVLVFVTKAVASIWLTKAMATSLALVEARAATHILRSIYGYGLERAQEQSREEIRFSSTIGASSAFTGLLNNLAVITAEGFMFIGLAVTFILIDPLATLCVLTYFAVLALVIHYFIGSRLSNSSSAIMETSISSNSSLNVLSDSFREITVLGKRDVFFESFLKDRQRAAAHIGRQVYLSGMPRYVVETAVLLGVLVFGGLKLLSGDLASSITTLGVFLTGSLRIMAAMLPWQNAIISIKQNIPQANLAQRYLRPLEELEYPIAPTRPTNNKAASIKASKVFYKYPGDTGRRAVSNVTLEIDSGSQVAIIGASGSGKSTLADLIMGLLVPDSGTVLIGDLPANRSQTALAYVPQQPGSLSGPLASLIAVGENESNIDLPRVERAIQSAHLSDFVASLPYGLETEIGADGEGLSGGQLQRLGIARALYSNPGVLLMDEATSALDAKSEHDVTKTLEALRGKVTVILIAHRLHTIQHVDRVFYMRNGEVVDSGKFDEVAKRHEDLLQAIQLSSTDPIT